MLANRYRKSILALITASAIVAMIFIGRIPQDPAYHQFADTRAIVGIPNFWNFISNVPFLLAGLYGLYRGRHLAEEKSRNAYLALCIGVLLVGIGSSYYHYAPSTQSLLWDRLPMTIAFMALFSLLLDERVILGSTSRTLWPLIALGIGSVAYWYCTEISGYGDLRPYALVQFLPMALIPTILLFFKRNYLNGLLLLSALALYFVAKVFEHFDQQLFYSIGILSGHTIKHLVASIAVLLIIHAVPVSPDKRL
ncbi:ceramidase domain-containing protein [Methyloglobulus sp.]|uniref:ceramidase domain-containing protein n=1 Tax=Methyloglobulus sp. TaxID=2518622 RepID=UPI0039892F1C